ncbi:DnaD domain protein [Alkalihalobacillus sp. MEB130]|uniref:replication initiation and membrane attachment family protein n=1 Tax=Alkalihalobacillus sp. MEB130 TaxID=2976704 RepID=UPI0028E03B94|nr:DnaD domain protein [Alkalihalobacillus sp. MEB130]MDT8859433.1 DnaD domain protein [Alkalihalobacillus sp. MEB130]
MSWHWKELLPVDRFSVRTSNYITEVDRLTLTLLYQPLTGAIAHSLYLTLLSQLEKDEYWSSEWTHRQLMLLLGVSLEVIYEERKKLEGIGLLKTFKHKDESGNATYLYELQPPMTPKQFFENDVLSVYLFNRLGKSHYRQLRDRFTLNQINRDDYMEMTHAFDEVYVSLHHSEMVSNLTSETGNALQVDKDKQLLSSNEQSELVFQAFDFELLEKSLSSFIVPDEALTEEVRKTISRLAFVYKIEPLEMSSIVQQALLHDEKVDLQQLRKKAQEWYKVEHGNEPPGLAMQKQPIINQTMAGVEPKTEEERAIKFYETTAPLELLEIRSDGAKVATADVKIIESLILDHQLLPGVANVLLDFMLYSQDMKLSKALVDKVAGHWSRKKVKTVKEAMQLALVERRKANEVANKMNQPPVQKRTNQKKQNAKRDKLPKWMMEEKENKQKNQKVEEDTQQESKADDQSFAQMLEQLRKSKEGGR